MENRENTYTIVGKINPYDVRIKPKNRIPLRKTQNDGFLSDSVGEFAE
jgi:hypothetical protein